MFDPPSRAEVVACAFIATPLLRALPLLEVAHVIPGLVVGQAISGPAIGEPEVVEHGFATQDAFAVAVAVSEVVLAVASFVVMRPPGAVAFAGAVPFAAVGVAGVSVAGQRTQAALVAVVVALAAFVGDEVAVPVVQFALSISIITCIAVSCAFASIGFVLIMSSCPPPSPLAAAT